MHPRIAEVIAYLDTNRSALERTLDEVPPALRERRPGADRWSVGETLAHLGIVEGRIVKLLTAQIAAAREAGLGPERETSPVVPTLDVTRVLDRSRPVTASSASLPPEGATASGAWAALVQRREELRATLLAADGLALSEVVAPNPVFGPINAYQWVVFAGAHEARHTAQIRETAAALARAGAIAAGSATS